MSATSGSLSSQALQSLQDTTRLTPEALKKLSSKLKDLVGEDAAKHIFQNGEPNQRGELLNEEGLPIIDITEPVPEVGELQHSRKPMKPSGEAVEITGETPLVPLSTYTPEELRLRKLRRDRMLDLLEMEEAEEQRKAELAVAEHRKEALEKRKETEKAEIEKLKAFKEIQQRMGKALVRNTSKTQEEKPPERSKLQIEPSSLPSSPSSPSVPSPTTKKSVTFNEEIPVPQSSLPEWGDVAPARLRSTSRPSLVSSISSLPMKMNVIERVSGGPSEPTKVGDGVLGDSDDESEPPQSPIDSTEEESDSSDNLLEEDEYDLDFAQQQRAIALEYYRKRNVIGQEAAKLMTSHSHEPEEDIAHEQHQHKAPVSRFKASRLAAAYNASMPSSAQSLGDAEVLPASSSRTLQNAIRLGKLDSQNLLAGGADENSTSDDESTEAVQEVLELLKKGEVYNVGPNNNALHILKPPSQAEPPISTVNLKPLPVKPKVSKFKLSRSTAGLPSQGQTDDKLVVIERNRPAPSSSPSYPSMIVDSPSFPNQSQPSATALESSATSPIVIESTPFPHNQRRPDQPPVVMSSVVRESAGWRSVPEGASLKEASLDRKKVSRFKAERMW